MREMKPYRWGDPMPHNARAVKNRRIEVRLRAMHTKLIALGFNPVTMVFSGEDAEAGLAGLRELGLLSEPAAPCPSPFAPGSAA